MQRKTKTTGDWADKPVVHQAFIHQAFVHSSTGWQVGHDRDVPTAPQSNGHHWWRPDSRCTQGAGSDARKARTNDRRQARCRSTIDQSPEDCRRPTIPISASATKPTLSQQQHLSATLIDQHLDLCIPSALVALCWINRPSCSSSRLAGKRPGCPQGKLLEHAGSQP